MTALLVAMMLAQFPTPFTVKDEGVPKGSATGVNCTGTGVTCTLGVGGIWTLNSTAGGGTFSGIGACGDSMWAHTLNDNAAPTCSSIYFSDLVGTAALTQLTDSATANLCLLSGGVVGDPAWGPCSVTLDQVGNPTADKTFTMANKVLVFSYQAPVAGTGGAFEIEAVGGFSGDLLHLHQHTGNPGAGTDLMHAEWSDTDVTGLRLTGPSAAATAATITGIVTASGFSGPLTGAVTGNASTASALAADGADCVGAGEFAKGTTAAGVASGCAVPPGTYTLPDAAAATKGGILLTGDLGGTAASPAVVDDSHAHTSSTVSGLDAANDISSGLLAGARGGGGAALPTCSGTDKLTANGTIWSCATDQTSAGGGYATVQDEGGALTQRTTIDFAGAGVTCADSGGTKTLCTIAGGGGAPGGSTTQLQYNNASAFAGMARVTTDGNDLILTRQSTHPAAPSAGFNKAVGFGHHGTSSPTLLQFTDGTTELEWHQFPYTLAQDDVWGCVTPAGSGNATLSSAGVAAYTGNTTGTAAAVNWAATDERTRHKWVQLPSATTASSSAGIRANADVMWRGNAAGLGGWYWWATVNIVTTTANQRAFFGLKDATAVITATTNPSASLNTVYFGCDAAQTTLRICSNDGTTAATCTDLGANFPCTTANIAYDVALWAAPNAASIGYYIRRLVNGSEAQGTVSTDLPLTTVALGWDLWINNGGTAAASTMQFGGTCYVANP